jgi:hypothetical protein
MLAWAKDHLSVTVHADELPRYVIWCRANLQQGWLRSLSWGDGWMTGTPTEATIFWDFNLARLHAEYLQNKHRTFDYTVRVRPGRKKV